MSPARSLRISGGRLRGLKLEVPAGVRPTSGRLREALFDIWGGRLDGCRFLDLFAGSGAVGLEAASRGAASVRLVEGERRVLTVLARNRRRAGLEGVGELAARLPEELARRLPAGERFDLIFVDPPYGFAGLEAVLAGAAPRLAPGGEIAVEHGWREREAVAAPGLRVVDRRRYGDSGLTLLRPAVAAPGAAR